MNFANQTIWITGASSGIGKALAIEFAKKEARIAISARSEEALEAVAHSIQKDGSNCLSIPCDVLDAKQLEHAYQKVQQQFGHIDIVIANAGTHVETWPERGFKTDEYLNIMNLNYGGVLRTFAAALPSMLERKSGILVGVSSLAGYRALPQAGAYGASKAALSHFLDSIRFHLKPLGVRVVTVNPGFVKTPLTDKNTFGMPFLISAEEAAQRIIRGIVSGKDIIAFPRRFAAILNFMRCLPYPLYDFIISHQWKRVQAKSK